jgi:hypothetical protein
MAILFISFLSAEVLKAKIPPHGHEAGHCKEPHGFVFCLKLKSTRNFPLRNFLQSKSNKNKKMRKTSSSVSYFIALRPKVLGFIRLQK